MQYARLEQNAGLIYATLLESRWAHVVTSGQQWSTVVEGSRALLKVREADLDAGNRVVPHAEDVRALIGRTRDAINAANERWKHRAAILHGTWLIDFESNETNVPTRTLLTKYWGEDRLSRTWTIDDLELERRALDAAVFALWDRWREWGKLREQ